MKSKAIICDLDGTLYDAVERQRRYLMGDKKNFDAFHRAAKEDSPHLWCAQLIQSMKNCGYRTIFTSGRDDTFREETKWWLFKHLRWTVEDDYSLHMRQAGDYTADDVMKREWYVKYIEPRYDVLFAVDDRKRVAKMWRDVGLTCLHCDEGEF